MRSAGSLRELVRIERRAGAVDGFGNVTGDWATLVDEIPAAIEPAKGAEEVIAGKLSGLTPTIVTVRWQANLAEGADRITTADRLVNARSGIPFDIRAIEADPKRQWITITAEAGGPT